MTAIFLKLLNMSITAGYLVLAVLLVRLFLKKSPKWISCLLWGIVALRLLLPFTIESPLSLIPSAEVIPLDIATSSAPAVYSGISAVNSAVNPMMTQQVIESGNLWPQILSVASVVWIAGAAGMLLYGIVSFLIMKRKLCAAIRVRDNIYIGDDIPSPFILGFFLPKIYLPSGMDDQTLHYVLLHENVHLYRKDHWWKPLGFCLLAIYWFNPLLWVAYILLCRDIEQSCDEKVISQMDNPDKKGYSLALVNCSSHRRMIMVCPVAFGEVGVKTRIKAIVSYKKPSFWILVASVALCVVISVCFLTNPETCLHAYADEIIQPATCTQMGIESHTCRFCRHSYTEPVAMCQHTDGMLTTVTEPTCVDAGEAVTSCTVCQVEYTVILPATPNVHSYEETILKESTCAEAGEGILTCTHCSHIESVTYELKEHDPIISVSDPGVCTLRGYEGWYCYTCGYEYVEYTDYGDHGFTDGRCVFCGKSEAVQMLESIIPHPPVPELP